MRRVFTDRFGFAVAPLAFLLIVLIYLWEIFSETPFLQHEMVGQAFWWTQDSISKLELFFDSKRMDCHLGRFRYIEYLVQAAYWNLMARGWIPRDLYDYFAVVLTIGSAIILRSLFRQRGLSHFFSLLLVAVFLFGAQVYMVHLFNFRKAKFTASFLFLVLLALNRTQWKSRGALIFIISLLGVMVDVYFILLVVPLLLADDYLLARKRFPSALTAFFGLMAGSVITFYLANVIGKTFSPNSGIAFGVPEGIPGTFLKWQNISKFALVLPDLLAPNLFPGTYKTIGYVGVVLLSVAIVVLLRMKGMRPGWLGLFLFSLPVAAFCLEPRRDWAYFTGYYGHTFFLFLVLALSEFVLALTSGNGRSLLFRKSAAVFCCISLLFCHLVSKPFSLESWKRLYSVSAIAEGRAFEDYLLMQDIRHRLAAGENPVEITLDSKNVGGVNIAHGLITDGGNNWRHTNLAYFFLPAAFKKEFDTGQFRIKLTKPEPKIITLR